MTAPDTAAVGWRTVVASLNRPYRVTLPMVILVSLVPFYVFIAGEARGRTAYMPVSQWDDLVPLQPVWALVYGALYLCLILLPVFVVRHEELLRRTVLAYLSVWITAYVCFLVYPTIAPRPDAVVGEGFGTWGLRFLYDADPPYNCFPSLHVAHSFVSALAVYRVHRSIGIGALLAASLVALSTLFTKQHYVADVIAGAGMAVVAYWLFLRAVPRAHVPDLDRRMTPLFAVGVAGIAAFSVAAAWVAYIITARL